MLLKLYICHLNWNVKRTKINKKRSGLAHFFKKCRKSNKNEFNDIFISSDCGKCSLIETKMIVGGSPGLVVKGGDS